MLEILKLIRLRTIAFTAFTMYAIRFFVVQPVLEHLVFLGGLLVLPCKCRKAISRYW